MKSLSAYVFKLNVFTALLLLCISSTQAALFDGCDYVYNISPGYAYLESPYYPSYYPASTSCRYKFVAPTDYYIQAQCTVDLVKGANSCSNEFLYIATDGDVQLRGAEQFCGSGNVARNSLFRSMTFAYASYNTGTTNTGRFRCQLYVSAQPCDCGWSVNTRIVNGVEAGINEYPHMAALHDKRTTQPSYCAASIVTHRFLVSAAHCVGVVPDASNVVAIVGDHDLTQSTDTIYAAQYAISQIIKHSGYVDDPVNNDIALYKTAASIEWSRGVGPICLPPASSASNNFAYSNVDVIGYGTTSFGGPTSPKLLKVNLVTIENSNCQADYTGTTIYNSQICTYDSTGHGRDSCQFDSGGPVILRKSRQFLLGIISFGKFCGGDGYPVGINTRITSYLTWINSNVGGGVCPVSL